MDPFARYIVFESVADLDVDGRTTIDNADGSQEVFILNRRPRKKLGGVCLGGIAPCDFTDIGAGHRPFSHDLPFALTNFRRAN